MGAQENLGGVIGAQVDLRTTFGFDATRPDHSAQFRRSVQMVKGYYDEVKRISDLPNP